MLVIAWSKLSVPREHKKIRSQGKFRNQNFVSSKIKVTVIIKVSFFPINQTKKTMISSPRKCASSSQSIFEKVEKKEMPADSTSNLVFALCLLLLLLFIERHPLYTLNPYRGEVTLLSAIYVQRFPRARRTLVLECKGRRELDCKTHPSSRDESRP